MAANMWKNCLKNVESDKNKILLKSYSIDLQRSKPHITKSTKYIDLQKRVNLTLQFISKMFQINQLVLNKNKTFANNFSCTKTTTRTLNIVLDKQNLTPTESSVFLGTHLDTNLSRTLHGKIIETLGIA